MKFSVGDKVTIQSVNKTWNGLRGVVNTVDPEEKVYPYSLTMIDGTRSGAYQSGEVAEAFREAELVATADVVAADIAEATRLLQKHGVPFRIYTRENVDKMLDSYGEDLYEPLDTHTFREEIVEFIMGGQDWEKLSEQGRDDEITLWNMVEGARNDHREWFVG